VARCRGLTGSGTSNPADCQISPENPPEAPWWCKKLHKIKVIAYFIAIGYDPVRRWL